MHYPPLSIGLISVSVILPLLAISAVTLRIRARHIKKIRLNGSDYVNFVACFICLGDLILGVVGGTIGGLGRPLSTMAPETTVIFMKVLFIMQFFHHVAIFFVKLSLVLFYKTIFPTPKFTIAANTTIVVLVAWIIAFFFATLFQDHPISRNWGTNGTTIDYPLFYTIENCTDIFLDIWILCMPLPVIKNLHMNKKKKWLLGGIFSLGFFCVVSSVIRLYYLITFDEQYTASRIDPFSYSTVNYMIWTTIEPSASVATACLPTYVALLQDTRIGSWMRSIGSGFQATLNSVRTSAPPSSSKTKKASASTLTNLEQDGDDYVCKDSSVDIHATVIEMEHTSAI